MSMLKRLHYNGRSIPVPVPVKTLHEALEWVCQTLLKADETITKVVLDDQEWDEHALQGRECSQTVLDDNSVLLVKADSPLDLSMQTLEAIRNLNSIMLRSLKPIAVESWQIAVSQKPRDSDALLGDLQLSSDLLFNFLQLTKLPKQEAEATTQVCKDLAQIVEALDGARQQGEWRGFARLLLNQLEPLLTRLDAELTDIQGLLFAELSSQALQFSQAKK